jgi:hypothetical protein
MSTKTDQLTSPDRWTPEDRAAAKHLATRHARAVERLRLAQIEAEATIAQFEQQFPEAGDRWADFVLDAAAEPLDQSKTNEEIHVETYAAIRGIVWDSRNKSHNAARSKSRGAS